MHYRADMDCYTQHTSQLRAFPRFSPIRMIQANSDGSFLHFRYTDNEFALGNLFIVTRPLHKATAMTNTDESLGYQKQLVHDDENKLNWFKTAKGLVQNELEHRYWTSYDFAFGAEITSFDGIEKPVLCVVYTPVDSPELAAYAEVHHNRFGWVFARMLVHPKHRRQGLGKQLLEDCLHEIYKHSEVAGAFRDIENTAAIELHNRYGFKVVQQYPEHLLEAIALNKSDYLSARFGKLLPSLQGLTQQYQNLLKAQPGLNPSGKATKSKKKKHNKPAKASGLLMKLSRRIDNN